MNPESFVEYFRWVSPRLSLLFGLGFLAANLRLLVELLQYRRRRRHALLVWEGARPKYYGLNLALGAVFGVLLAVNVFWLHRPLRDLFGAFFFVTVGALIDPRRLLDDVPLLVTMVWMVPYWSEKRPSGSWRA